MHFEYSHAGMGRGERGNKNIDADSCLISVKMEKNRELGEEASKHRGLDKTQLIQLLLSLPS